MKFSRKFDINAIKNTVIPNLDIISSTQDLAASEIELADFSKRESTLKNIVNKIDGYDFIFIDKKWEQK